MPAAAGEGVEAAPADRILAVDNKSFQTSNQAGDIDRLAYAGQWIAKPLEEPGVIDHAKDLYDLQVRLAEREIHMDLVALEFVPPIEVQLPRWIQTSSR